MIYSMKYGKARKWQSDIRVIELLDYKTVGFLLTVFGFIVMLCSKNTHEFFNGMVMMFFVNIIALFVIKILVIWYRDVFC